jgi:hypothetical protein
MKIMIVPRVRDTLWARPWAPDETPVEPVDAMAKIGVQPMMALADFVLVCFLVRRPLRRVVEAVDVPMAQLCHLRGTISST